MKSPSSNPHETLFSAAYPPNAPVWHGMCSLFSLGIATGGVHQPVTRSVRMNFRGKAGPASSLADSLQLTHADVLCCVVPIVVFLSLISVV